MMVGFPLVVKTTFFLSGMLGLNLQGLNNNIHGNGQTINLEFNFPFTFNNKFNPGNNINNEGTDGEYHITFRPPTSKPPPSTSPVTTETSSKPPNMITSTPRNSSELGSASPVGDIHNEIETSTQGYMKCGAGLCTPNEICVSWENQDKPLLTTTQRRRKSLPKASSFQECMPKDDVFSSHANPKNLITLCQKGQTHSIVPPKAQPCLKDQPPCPLVWKYNCIDESMSPHSCQLKRCPPHFICFEYLHCSIDSPCVPQVECHHRDDVFTNN